MMIVKYMIAILLYFFIYTYSYAHSLSSQLITITNSIQKLENLFYQLEKEIEESKKSEKQILSNIRKGHSSLGSALTILKNQSSFSLLNSILAEDDSKTVVHKVILMNYLTPAIYKKNLSTFSKLKKISNLRKNIVVKKNAYKESQQKYTEYLYNQKQLLQSRFNIIDFTLKESFDELPSSHIIVEDFFKKISNYVDHKLYKKGSSSLKLVQPVIGEKVVEVIKTTDYKSTPYKVDFMALHYGQVIAPITGKIVQVKQSSDKNYIVIVNHQNYFVILKGIGFSYCRQGDSVQTGEPIGYMIKLKENNLKKSFSNKIILSLELYEKTKSINPLDYIQSNNA